jgi:small GTP-binding protein
MSFTSMKAKVVLVGSAHTGKTSIINRYIYGEFSPHTMPSTQPAFFQKKVHSCDVDVTLEIWDTAGQEQYHALSPMFYRDAEAGIVVFDLTDKSTFSKCKQWVSELRQARGDSITLAVAGNKNDLPSVRTVNFDAIASFASTIGAESFETSAKTGENVDLLFSALVKTLVRKAQSGGEGAEKSPAVPKKIKSSVNFDELPEKRGGCC